MATAQNKERRSGSRQFHRKSRNSCLTCRRRRVRCNLQPPICANCHRRNEHCSYQEETRDLSPILLSNSHLNSHTRAQQSAHIPLIYKNFDFILNGFQVETDLYRSGQDVVGASFSPITGVMEKTFFLSWLSIIEKVPIAQKASLAREFGYQASTFQYVYRTITALYALHEWSQDTPGTNLYAAAYQYHIEASTLFRHTQVEVNEANWIAVLVFAIGVIVFQFAATLKTPDSVDDYFELLYVLRNSSDLAIELAPYLRTSPLMQLIEPHLSRLKSHLDDFTWNAVCRLDSLEYPADTTEETRCACQHSIAVLKEWVVKVDGHPGSWRDFMDWPAAVSEPYLVALSQKHSVALVVFAYWCAIMHRSPRRWYTLGWAERAADAAMRYLGEEWDSILEFPRTILSNELQYGESPTPTLIEA
ncbi:uncharacterized protein F4822DRAFT_275649 [Hypoxylon trugodes]|uniref:uncharacterized protein n=1 Tax=Hypoxylon trugodes TaxID=326681 RepID=UPI0021A143D5|nr:uncharacterized protein F4822DRAFT_275649 [Hypoxylon trugodes]KAI1387166.1 hypothetical protein F4822DRAFT_275649 [Hypoxylon trugodes]